MSAALEGSIEQTGARWHGNWDPAAGRGPRWPHRWPSCWMQTGRERRSTLKKWCGMRWRIRVAFSAARRWLPTVLVVVAGILLTAADFTTRRRMESQRIEADFKRQST